MRKSKIGLHYLAGYDHWQYVTPMLQQHHPRGALLLEDLAQDLIDEVVDHTDFPAMRAIWPREQISGGYQSSHDPNVWMETLLERRPWIVEAGERAAAQGKSIGICGHNEPQSEDLGLMADYGAFEAERAHLLDGYDGLHAIVGNFGVGRTSKELMDVFLPPLISAFQRGTAVLGLHEYWYLMPWCLMLWDGWNFLSTAQGGQSLFFDPLPPVPTPQELGEAWLFGRFTMLGLPPWLPVVLTEFGWDQVYQAEQWGFPVRDEGPYTGIVNSRYRLNREYGLSFGEGLGFFLSHDVLDWADRFLQQFPQVRCAYFFSGGGDHYEDEFLDYNLTRTEAQWPLAQYISDSGNDDDRRWRSIRFAYTLWWLATGRL